MSASHESFFDQVNRYFNDAARIHRRTRRAC